MHSALKVKQIENVSRNREGIRGFPGEEIFKQGPDEQESEFPSITS